MSTIDFSWVDHATCSERTELPWLRDSAEISPWEAETMRALCDDCPVSDECLAAVDALTVCGGWWAGRDRDRDAQGATLDAWHPLLVGGSERQATLFDLDAIAGAA
ncbi:hypothetical protein [Mobilicoccus pelagius]|uniref:4Fe-4S Wbl-type domain-containing protein n=1 Tax=Mobilicoccus pelagius NBRC 104925 TaxID=1089455 RepID=H5USK8_9MICO|nr:hypothetical protein [Mobilicoccus pelagius]GAB48716.1 hypothetical protein MOPEL_078_01050 [Mobilicoccus pelagius NBRC 104925]